MLNIFGGKITTYRKLAEAALDKIVPFFPGTPGAWTAGVAMPGGDFPVDGVENLVSALCEAHPFLTDRWALRLIRAYGTEAADMLAGAKTVDDLGVDFGATLTQREVEWLITHEYARTADDIVWRRSKVGLRLSKAQITTLDDWMKKHDRAMHPAAAE